MASVALLVAGYPTLAAETRTPPPSNARRVAAAAAPADGEVESLGSFTDGLNYSRKYVLVGQGLTEAQLIRLAKRLHAEEPRTWFWLFDDKSKFPLFWATVRKTEQSDIHDYPLDWARDHTVGHVGLQLRPHAPRRWVLMKGAGADVLADLGGD